MKGPGGFTIPTDEGGNQLSAEACAKWLDCKFARHHEVEDHAAAEWLRYLAANIAHRQLLVAEMIREAEAHMPFVLRKNSPERWQWFADYLNDALRDPDKPCRCCNVTPAGDVLDHLSVPPPIDTGSSDHG